MKYFTVISLMILMSYCKSRDANESLIKKSNQIEIEDSITIEKVYNGSFNECESNFIEKLKKIKIQEYPFNLNSYLLDSLYKRGVSLKKINELKESDSIFKEGLIYNPDFTFNDIKNTLNKDLLKYYNLLFYATDNYGGSCCEVSNEYVFKRFNKIGNRECFLTISKFKDATNYERGIIINLVLFDVNLDKEIDKKNILISGEGFDNVIYYEGFVFKDRQIKVKGYTYVEPEVYIISKKININNENLIDSSHVVKIIDNEE